MKIYTTFCTIIVTLVIASVWIFNLDYDYSHHYWWRFSLQVGWLALLLVLNLLGSIVNAILFIATHWSWRGIRSFLYNFFLLPIVDLHHWIHGEETSWGKMDREMKEQQERHD